MAKSRSTELDRARGLTNTEIITLVDEKIRQFTDKEVNKLADIAAFELMAREDEFQLSYEEDEDLDDEQK